MQTTFLEWLGKNAGYISAIIGCVTLLLIKPIIGPLTKRRKEAIAKKENMEKAFQSEVLERLDALKSLVADTGMDVAALQADHLNQAHDYYMEKGYCPTERKEFLCSVYKSYHEKGHNHLSQHYEEDLIRLPDKPPRT